MRITFVYPDVRKHVPNFGGYYAEGIASLAGMVKAAGHEPSLLHITAPPEEKTFVERLEGTRPDLVGFSSMTNAVRYVRQMALWTKQHVRVPTIFGGTHPTVDPEDAVQVEGIDLICVGEGEETLVDVMEALQGQGCLERIPNVWLRRGDTIIRNEARRLVDNLDDLPPPERHIFDFANLSSSRENEAYFMGSRGCPFRCTYCANNNIRDNYPNRSNYLRYKSVDRVIREIQAVLKEYPYIRYINFIDDILPANIKWFEEFAERYPREVGLPFHCNIYPALVKERVVKLMVKAGCTSAALGLESGNQELRFKVLQRRVVDDQLINAMNLLTSHGIKVATYNMVGLPYETMPMVLDTIKMNAKFPLAYTYVTIFHPYPGTALAKLCAEEGLISSRDDDLYMEGPVLSQECISHEQVGFSKRYFGMLIKLYWLLDSSPTFTRLADRILTSRKVPFGLLNRLYDACYAAARTLYLHVIRYFYKRVAKFYD